MLPKVSVIIPTLNSWVTLRASILSIYRQALAPYEILVVDNASSDSTSENVKKEFPIVKLVTLDKNTGVTGGRNTGIDKANKNSQYLLFFDHDIIADKNMLANLIDVAEMDKSFGIVTPKIFYWEDKQRVWAAGTNINLWTGQVLFRGGKDKGQFENIEEVGVAPAAILVKKEVINKIKKFDDRYFATYEDTDFCFRAKQEGFLTIYAPAAIAYHDISPDPNWTASRLLNRAFWVGKNRILFMSKFAKNFPLFLIISLVYLLYFIYLSIWQRNFKGLFDYVRGYMVGLKNYVLI